MAASRRRQRCWLEVPPAQRSGVCPKRQSTSPRHPASRWFSPLALCYPSPSNACSFVFRLPMLLFERACAASGHSQLICCASEPTRARRLGKLCRVLFLQNQYFTRAGVACTQTSISKHAATRPGSGGNMDAAGVSRGAMNQRRVRRAGTR